MLVALQKRLTKIQPDFHPFSGGTPQKKRSNFVGGSINFHWSLSLLFANSISFAFGWPSRTFLVTQLRSGSIKQTKHRSNRVDRCNEFWFYRFLGDHSVAGDCARQTEHLVGYGSAKAGLRDRAMQPTRLGERARDGLSSASIKTNAEKLFQQQIRNVLTCAYTFVEEQEIYHQPESCSFHSLTVQNTRYAEANMFK